MTAKDLRVARLRGKLAAEVPGALPSGSIRVGELQGAATPSSVLVTIPGLDSPVAVRLAIPLRGARLKRAIDERRQVVVAFEGGAADRGLVIGLLEPVAAAGDAAASVDAAPTVVEADVDGERVRVVGRDEIVLECGEASITLRRNGRVVIRGTYVETASAGTNRIKGGQVRIN